MFRKHIELERTTRESACMLDSLQFWTDIALEAYRASRDGEDGRAVSHGGRELATVHLAMYDACVAVERPNDFAPHLRGLPATPEGVSVAAAVAGAAHEALTVLFPDQRATFDDRLAAAGIPAGDPGESFGRTVAAAILAERAREEGEGGDEGEDEDEPAPVRAWPRAGRLATIARGTQARPFHDAKAFRILRAA